MKTRTTSTAPIKMIREARSHGKRDGKNQVPRQEWTAGSVPYLSQLRNQFIAYARQMDLAHEEKKLAKEAQKVNATRAEIQEKTKFLSIDGNLVRAKEELEEAKATLDGGKDEVPMAKFARMRMIGNTFYIPFLFLLFIGEFTITAPAFRVLLGEKRGPALIVTLAVSGLSVGAAHIFGIFLKSQFDRSRPKSNLFNLIFIAVGALLILTIIFLSYIRASNSALTSGNLTGIPERLRVVFLWGFYSVLQLTFVGVGTTISFMHYSEVHSQVLRAKVKVWYHGKVETHRNAVKVKSGSSSEEADVDVTKLMDQEFEVIESRKILLRAQYEEIVAIYRDANIYARKDEMSGSHPALQPLELDFRGSEIDFNTSELMRAL